MGTFVLESNADAHIQIHYVGYLSIMRQIPVMTKTLKTNGCTWNEEINGSENYE